MTQRRVAAPYAKALFALAKERNQTEVVDRELDDVAVTFEGDLELRDFFAGPWIPAPPKRTVATEVAQRSGLSKLTSDFLALVAGCGRTGHLKAIASSSRAAASCWTEAARGVPPSNQTEMPKRLLDCLTLFGRARFDATTPTGAVRRAARR